MLKFFGFLFERYGLDTVQIAIIVFLGWKLATNHLHHLKLAIGSNAKKLNKLGEKVDSLSERISTLEGKTK